MIFDFNTLKNKYNLNIKGIIHVGGHQGQEYDLYKHLDIPFLFFEPSPINYSILKNKVKDDLNVLTFQCALGNENKKVIIPSKWFGVYNSHLNTNDLYCDKWIKL